VPTKIENILKQLELGDLVRLDESWPQRHRKDLHVAYFSGLPAVSIQHTLQGLQAVWIWMWSRHLRINSILLRGKVCKILKILRRNADMIRNPPEHSGCSSVD
jgi:hypothetical protein